MLGLTLPEPENLESQPKEDEADADSEDSIEKVNVDAYDVRHQKRVYLNKRWQREDDMRSIIRDLAENGEKMIQKDRSRDYKEEFEESVSNESEILEEGSDDEEGLELKRQATSMRSK